MEKVYYKVVFLTLGKKLRSFNEVTSVEYVVNAWVYPEILNSKLFVFDTLDHARSFYIHDTLANLELRIYSCLVKNPVVIRDISCYKFSQHIFDFWNNPARFELYGVKTVAPTGTIGCDAVKLLEEC